MARRGAGAGGAPGYYQRVARHPQFEGFKQHSGPLHAIAPYLRVFEVGWHRGYAFDFRRIVSPPAIGAIAANDAQLMYEWRHLLTKLRGRSPRAFESVSSIATPDSHPFFHIVSGRIELWEKVSVSGLL